MKKRALAWLLTMVLIVTTLITPAFAVEPVDGLKVGDLKTETERIKGEQFTITYRWTELGLMSIKRTT